MPLSGDRLRSMKTVLNRALVEPMRTSQASAMLMPAPAATPLMAPISGLSKWAKRLAQRPTQPSSSSRSDWLAGVGAPPPTAARAAAPDRSAPEQNPLPAPVTIAARTASSWCAASIAVCTSSRTAAPIAFSRSGRFKVMIATGPRVS
jgi:hypothetical protein